MCTIGTVLEGVYGTFFMGKSDTTELNYRGAISSFFEKVFKKPMEDVTPEDINSLTKQDVYSLYIAPLMTEEGCKNVTINTKAATIRSFMQELSCARGFESINLNRLNNEVLKTSSLKDDTEHHELLTEEDHKNLYDYLLANVSRGNQGYKYAEALELLFKTGGRVNAMFNTIKWTDFKWQSDSNGLYGWVLSVLDKGDKIAEKPIGVDYYEHLKEVFYKGDDDALVLEGLSMQTFQRKVRDFGRSIGKKITVHSIRVGAATAVYKMTKDLVVTQKFMNHSDPETTVRYIHTDDDRTNTGSHLLTANPDMSLLNNFSQEELINLLQGECKDLGMALLARQGLVK